MLDKSEDSTVRKEADLLTVLPSRAVYALRAMAVLANLAPGESLRGQELAEQAAIPKAFVSKVMRQLVAAGLVDGRRGHGGGFRLAVSPSSITFTAILAAVGFAVDTGRCALGFSACDAERPCVLHQVWTRFRTALEAWADGTVLAETRQ